jgi:hypothetical protein
MKYTFVKYDQLCHSERSNEIAKSLAPNYISISRWPLWGKNLKVGLRAVLFATIFLAACGDDNKNAGGTVEDPYAWTASSGGYYIYPSYGASVRCIKDEE